MGIISFRKKTKKHHTEEVGEVKAPPLESEPKQTKKTTRRKGQKDGK